MAYKYCNMLGQGGSVGGDKVKKYLFGGELNPGRPRSELTDRRKCYRVLVRWFVRVGRGGSSFAMKREYDSVITYRHTRVMIWEIGRGVGCVLTRCFCSFLRFSCIIQAYWCGTGTFFLIF